MSNVLRCFSIHLGLHGFCQWGAELDLTTNTVRALDPITNSWYVESHLLGYCTLEFMEYPGVQLVRIRASSVVSDTVLMNYLLCRELSLEWNVSTRHH